METSVLRGAKYISFVVMVVGEVEIVLGGRWMVIGDVENVLGVVGCWWMVKWRAC
jgi:hypothetical protein